MKRILSALLVCAMLLGCAATFSSCGSKKPVKTKAEHVYRVTTIPVGSENNWINRIFSTGGKYYATIGESDPVTYAYKNVTYEISPEEKALKPANLGGYNPETGSGKENKYLMTSAYCESGASWHFYNSYTMDEKTQEYTERNTILLADKSGKVVFEKDLNELMKAEYTYVQYASASGEDVVFTDGNGNVYKVDTTGKLARKVSLKNNDANAYIDISRMECEGDIVKLISQDYTGGQSKATFMTIDMKSGKTDKTELPAETFRNVWNYYLGPGYSLYYSDSSALYGYDIASQKSTELMNYLNSDVTSSMVNNVLILSPDRFISTGYDESSGGSVLSILDRIPEDEIPEKYIITLATINGAYSASRNAVRFNRESDEYRVVIRDYNPDKYAPTDGSDYNYQDLIKLAIDEMNNDILGGNVPDILLVNEYVPLENYAAKGMLVNLYDFMDKDPEIKRADYLQNILKALEIGGKLYRIMPYFAINTLAAKTKNVNGMTSWNMEQFIKWKNSLPADVKVFREMTRDNLLQYFLSYAHDDFIDSKTGRCNFDTKDFRLLLEYVASVSEKSIWDDIGDDYDQQFWEDYENALRNDKAMLESFYVSNFYAYRNATSYTFYDEDITFIGLPVAEGNGSSITCDEAYAIFKKSNLKDGAWSFVSYFLKQEYQDGLNQFPIRIASLEALADRTIQADEERIERQKQQEQETATKNALAGVAVTEPYYGSEQMPITREVTDKIIAFVKSVNRTSSTNLNVINIIREEAGPYFAGQKSLDETVKIIQNRVSTVVAESR